MADKESIKQEVNEQAFEEEMKSAYQLFMKAHFGEPVCNECLTELNS